MRKKIIPIKPSNKKRPIIYIVVVTVLVISNALSVYEVHRALGQSVEEITYEDISAIEWIAENLDKNMSIKASDHRIERVAEAKGFNTTQDETFYLWTEPKENYHRYIPELYAIGHDYNYSRITHVFVDDIMLNQVVHIGFKEENITMTYEPYKKFNQTPYFELVHESRTVETDPITDEPIHWARVFKVNWSYFLDEQGLKYLV